MQTRKNPQYFNYSIKFFEVTLLGLNVCWEITYLSLSQRTFLLHFIIVDFYLAYNYNYNKYVRTNQNPILQP